MNTRGLMELIVLNIGYDLGVLNQQIFTMLVFMALITTFMTSPMLNFLDRYKHSA
jgi:Kef-type K+ transport system membrane component KefB